MIEHWHREHQYFLGGTWRDEKLLISCRNRKRWVESVRAVASSAHTATWRRWVDRKSLKNTIHDKSLQSLSNAHPAYCWLSFYNGKISLENIGTKSEGNKASCRYLSSGIRLIFCWREALSILGIFSNNSNLSSAIGDIRSPNTMGSLTNSKGKVKFGSSLCGSPTSSG